MGRQIFKEILIFIFVILGVNHSNASVNGVWSKGAKKLYAQRKFVELEQVFLAKKRPAMAENVRLQSQDLYGCMYLHEGHGQESSFESCLRFLIREKKMQISSPQRHQTLSDMNLICQRFSEKKAFIERMLRPDAPNLKSNEWKTCAQAIWKQIFLTVHANFRASPVASIASVRRAEVKLLPDVNWQQKINGVMRIN